MLVGSVGDLLCSIIKTQFSRRQISSQYNLLLLFLNKHSIFHVYFFNHYIERIYFVEVRSTLCSFYNRFIVEWLCNPVSAHDAGAHVVATSRTFSAIRRNLRPLLH
ncbi:MAG TPA: hypothetical protein DCW74_06355 [Alteromonas australica]|uniref:Uncharacterized protein n=1 Tax=Alteromonas australica TaxID=589873 RepID=A0A350P226_9ALTE|nr:hypothetical protein [Alteromonas australica]HBU53064.1 hypothetical protein [Alteromonas australica]